MKTCTRCGEGKALADFHKKSARKDGRQLYCKACVREYRARYNAENTDARREYSARWYAENTDRKREYMVRYNAENTEARRDYYTHWRTENPDKSFAKAARRRAAKRNAPHSPYDRSEIFARYDGKCAYVCDAPAEHLDHVVALSKGGADAEANLLPACAHHNLTKGAKSLADWALEPF